MNNPRENTVTLGGLYAEQKARQRTDALAPNFGTHSYQP